MKYFLAAFFCLVMAAFDAYGEVKLRSHDFAFGFNLSVDQGSPFYRVLLPREVYRLSVRHDRGDMRVFDQQGKEIPHLLRLPEVEMRDHEPVSIPFFALHPPVEMGDAFSPGDLALRVERSRTGAIVSVRMENSEVSRKQPIGFLLDLQGFDSLPSTIELYWRKPLNRLLNLQVDQSSDLSSWQPLPKTATIAELRHGDRTVIRRIIRLPSRVQPYLRLTWDSGQEGFELERVLGLFGKKVTKDHTQHLDLKPEAMHWFAPEHRAGKAGGGYLALPFTVNHSIRLTEAQVKLPLANSSFRGALYSRPGEGEDWRIRCHKVFYNLAVNGEQLCNEPCVFGPVFDAQWELRVYDDGAGIGDGEKPVLELGWMQEELLFAGQGTPPYLLAFGNGAVLDTSLGGMSESISNVLAREKGVDLIAAARIDGPMVELAGERALAVPEQVNWKRWLLWAVLAMGLCLLAAMVRMVLRELAGQQGK